MARGSRSFYIASMIKRLLIILLALLLPAAANAAHIKVALVAETDHPASGKPLTVAIVMQPDPGWHDYWSNPGDTGIATSATWSVPASVRVPGELRYPVPQTLLVAGLMNHVYEGPHALLVETAVKPGVAAGTTLPIADRPALARVQRDRLRPREARR